MSVIPSAGDVLVSVRHLTVTAGGRRILDDAALDIASGEVVGLIGASGAGKTTLALSLLGHLRPGLERVAGTVRVAGLDPFDARARSLVRTRAISFLGQDPAAELDPAWRIGAQVRARARQVGRRTGAREVERLLGRLGLPDGAGRRYPHQLSGGQVRRAAFALALVGSPRLLVLDEPTSGLDTASAQVLADLVDERDPGCAVLLITHDHSALARSADRVLRVDAGTVQPAAVGDDTDSAVQDGRGGDLVLRARGLTAAYGGRTVLAPVDLSLRAGATCAVVGPSGAGKSTLARVLLGLQPRRSGTQELRGHRLAPDLAGRSGAQRRAIQLVPQDATGSLNPAETVGRTLSRALAAGGQPRSRSAAAGLLASVHLEECMLARRPGELSGGERQRVAVARALACRPQVLVCDEITSALDAATARSVLTAVDRLREAGTSVVLITHDRDEVTRWAHHTVEIAEPGCEPG